MYLVIMYMDPLDYSLPTKSPELLSSSGLLEALKTLGAWGLRVHSLIAPCKGSRPRQGNQALAFALGTHAARLGSRPKIVALWLLGLER